LSVEAASVHGTSAHPHLRVDCIETINVEVASKETTDIA
jgi:hypothetical protein